MNKHERYGVTLLEVIILVVVILVLVGLFVPVTHGPSTNARKTAVKAQLYGLSQGLEMFKNDFGSYPQSSLQTAKGVTLNTFSADGVVNGFHRLGFSLLGRDCLGCPAREGPKGTGYDLPSPDSDSSPDSLTGWYYSTKSDESPMKSDKDRPQWRGPGDAEWNKRAYQTLREAPYIDSKGYYVVDDMVVDSRGAVPVLCDKYDQARNDSIRGPEDYKDHSIILYFRAGADRKWIGGPPAKPWSQEIYLAEDNWRMVKKDDSGKIDQKAFWTFIEKKGPRKSAGRFPHNPDTFILVSPGKDGHYFTEDDVANFEF